jgi:hypothetical protein
MRVDVSHAQSRRDPYHGVAEYRLRADRGDDETAAYVLQHWMEQL